jgi:PAS domain S-box-containing protein
MPYPISPDSSAHDLRLVVDTIPVMAWIVLPDGKLDFLNRPWLEYSGLSMKEAMADPTGTIHPDDLPSVTREWQDCFAGGHPYEGEMRLRRADGEYRWFLVRTVALRDAGGNIMRWYGTSTDIEDRKRAEGALRESERLLREAQELGHTGSWEQDLLTGRIVNTDENARLFFGDDTSKGARLEDYFEAVHPADRDYVARRREQLLAEGGPGEIEFRVVWSNGEIHVLRGMATVVRDAAGKPVRVYGTNLDVTERQRAEEKLQALTHRLVELQEAQRREISRELHDRVGQTLTALLLNMQTIRNLLPAAAERDVHAPIDDSIHLIQSAFDAVRDVMYELRPPMLDEYGLVAPLKWFAKKFSDRTGVAVKVVGEEGRRPDPETELALFRIAQESLTNVARHSRATQVEISLAFSDGEVAFAIEDNGVGIRKGANPDRPGYGLISMRERAESVGGTFEAVPRRGGGTRVIVRVRATPIASEGDYRTRITR